VVNCDKPAVFFVLLHRPSVFLLCISPWESNEHSLAILRHPAGRFSYEFLAASCELQIAFAFQVLKLKSANSEFKVTIRASVIRSGCASGRNEYENRLHYCTMSNDMTTMHCEHWFLAFNSMRSLERDFSSLSMFLFLSFISFVL
jgi:hypothetical protein